VKVLIDALQMLGVKCSPTEIFPGGLWKGEIRLPGSTSLPAISSSQYVSALLHIAPFAKEGMIVKLTAPLESRP